MRGQRSEFGGVRLRIQSPTGHRKVKFSGDNTATRDHRVSNGIGSVGDLARIPEDRL